MKTTKGISLFTTVILASLAGAAHAENDNELRLGAYLIHYNAQAQDATGSGIAAIPSGDHLNLSVDNVQTLYFAYVRHLSSHFDLELAAGIPPKTNTIGKGSPTFGSVPFAGQTIATTRWFSPTMLVNYKFLDESSAFRPYLGLGINYTHFYNNASTAAGDAVGGGPTLVSLSDSVGASGTIGISYRVQKDWTLYGSYSQTHIRSSAVLTSSGASRSTTVDFQPGAVVLSAGYSF